ncbi:hypothetical protein CCHOA_08150 [Corynebacterium choanae]|uniref:Uncharacterized protein n=1 Tax=Corynebacterium choanae TaxID=1862358 RepID=A0A3G6J7D1_9CORY|nr:hypothetical protein CCHOA_08150 [Corynebacterium choanae]
MMHVCQRGSYSIGSKNAPTWGMHRVVVYPRWGRWPALHSVTSVASTHGLLVELRFVSRYALVGSSKLYFRAASAATFMSNSPARARPMSTATTTDSASMLK